MKSAVVVFPGINRERDMMLALEAVTGIAPVAVWHTDTELPKVDLIVVPALAVAPTGHRLGYGGGFYDVMLPDFCPPATAVVVAFDFQLVAELPAEPHDVACALVVTDARTLAALPSA